MLALRGLNNSGLRSRLSLEAICVCGYVQDQIHLVRIASTYEYLLCKIPWVVIFDYH
jgi:hypothetical protein